MEPPWSLRIQDEAPLTLVAVVRGEAWIVADGRAALRLAPGGWGGAWVARPGRGAPGVVRALGASGRRRGAALDPPHPGPPREGGGAAQRDNGAARGLGPPLQRPRRRAADGLPRRLAD